MAKSVAAIFAHPDDEVLGCGAALAAHTASGDRVRILLLATGLAARGAVDESALKALREQAEAAAKILGAEAVSFDDFPGFILLGHTLHPAPESNVTLIASPSSN